MRKFSLYLWLATRYNVLRRLFIYPDTASVGVPDNYDDYWAAKLGKNQGRMSPYRQARADTLARFVRPGSKVLELGVGDGAMLKHLIDTRAVVGYGLDVSPQAVAFCQSQGLNVALADMNEPVGAGIEDHYDVILMCELIEHLPDPEALLNRLRDQADYLIISIPNTGYHQHRLRLLLGRFPLQWIVTPGEHLRFWTVKDFHWWAGQMGFKVLHSIAYTGTPFLRNMWPNLFGQGMVYVLADTRSATAPGNDSGVE